MSLRGNYSLLAFFIKVEVPKSAFCCTLLQEQIKVLEGHKISAEKKVALIQANFDKELSANATIKEELIETKRRHDLEISSTAEQFTRNSEFIRMSYEQKISELDNV